MYDLDEHASTPTGDLLHLWNDPSVGKSAEIDVQLRPTPGTDEQVVCFTLVCSSDGQTEELFRLLQSCSFYTVELAEADDGK